MLYKYSYLATDFTQRKISFFREKNTLLRKYILLRKKFQVREIILSKCYNYLKKKIQISKKF